VAQLQEALQNCQYGSAAQRQVLTQLKATRAKVRWLQTLKEFVLRRAKKFGHSLNANARASPMTGRHDMVRRGLEANEELLVQDVRVGMGEYEAHCMRCLLLGRIPRLPFDAQKNELLLIWARSRGIHIKDVSRSSPNKL
jgi:hypothetical protein